MSSWMMPPVNPAARMRLFCLSYAGGGASAYRNWLRRSSESLDIVAVQLPGRENRMAEPLLTSMEDLVTQVSKEIAQALDRPFAIFGHSLGARVAFEVIRELRRCGQPLPSHLFVSGSRSPEIPEPRPLHHLGDDDFVRELRRFSGTPQVILQNEELMELFLPILRADFTIDETYRYTVAPPLPVSIIAFHGSDDDEATLEEMEGWQRHTASNFRLRTIRGGHFFIQDAWRDVLDDICETLMPSNGYHVLEAV